MTRFDEIMTTILKWEGGYVDDPNDPGGATNMGITHRVLAKFRGVASVSPREVRALEKSEAIEIYRELYWERLKGDDLPHAVDLVMMDGGVNHGIGTMAKMLQTIVGSSADGIIGSATLAAVNSYIARNDVIDLLAALAEKRRQRYVTRPHAPRFLRGWRNRLEDVMRVVLSATGATWGFDSGLRRGVMDDSDDLTLDALSLMSGDIRPAIEDSDLQIYMQAKGTYTDAVDGLFGRNSLAGMNAILERRREELSGTLAEWGVPRRKVALGQLLCQEAGIEVARIDGLFGPQTEHAFMTYNRQKYNLPEPVSFEELLDAPGSFTPTVTPSTVWPRQRDLRSFYGAPCEVELVRLRLPYTMRIAWDLSQSVNSFFINKMCHDSAARAFQKISETYSPADIRKIGLDIFSGCYNCRKIRGGTGWSTHAWGISIDFDNTRNKLEWDHRWARLAKPDATPFWEIWEAEGWVSLGRARDFDWMHVQAARL